MPSPLRLLVLLCSAYAFLGALWWLSHALPRFTTLSLLLAAIALSIPAMLALWHRVTAVKALALMQFAEGSLARWLTVRRALAFLWRGILALALALAVTLQSPLFGAAEWVALVALPLLYVVAHAVVAALVARQFRASLYASRWVMMLARALAVSVALLLWAGIHLATAGHGEAAVGEAVHALQVRWAGAPSAIVRWVLDAGAWEKVALDRAFALIAAGRPGDLPAALGGAIGGQAGPFTAAMLRLVALLLLAPLALFVFVSLVLSGLTLRREDLARIFGPLRPATDPPGQVAMASAAMWGALTVIVAVGLFQIVGILEQTLRLEPNPFALIVIPDCERIGGVAYRVGTVDGLLGLTRRASRIADMNAEACRVLRELPGHAEPAIRDFLDWYYSLRGDYARLAATLTGDVSDLLRERLEMSLARNADLQATWSVLQDLHERRTREITDIPERIARLLEESRLVLDERSCRAVRDLPVNPWDLAQAEFGETFVTLAHGGLLAEKFASTAAAAAGGGVLMQKAGAKLAAALAKKAATKAAGTAGWAALGAMAGSFAPGVGTAVGALLGAVGGLVIGVGFDWGILVLDEAVHREDLAAELRLAVQAGLVPIAELFSCPAT